MKKKLVTVIAMALFLCTQSPFRVKLNAQGTESQHVSWKLKGADDRIEKYRRGDITLQFEFPDGSILTEKTPVQLSLENHAFHFGTSTGQISGILDDALLEKYKKYVGEICNYLTLGVYWGMIERVNGEITEPEYFGEIWKWAEDKDMTLRGHPLLWHNVVPAWLREMSDTSEVDRLIRMHIDFLITSYPQMDHWDVYNEAVAAFKNHTEESGVTRWVSYMGGVEPAVESLFSLVNKINSEKVYVNNHYTHTHPEFKELNRYLIEKGSAPDAIGIQTHMHKKEEVLGEGEMWDMLEDYSQFNIPLHLSEVTFLSSEPFEDWMELQEQEENTQKARRRGELDPLRPSSPEWEQKQADYLRDFYTLAFSHPAVEAIIYWNATDLSSWRGTASGFLDVEMNPKPAYEALRELIREKWNTSLKDHTSRKGGFSFRGFYGDYSGQIKMDDAVYYFDFEHNPAENAGSKTVKLKKRK